MTMLRQAGENATGAAGQNLQYCGKLLRIKLIASVNFQRMANFA